MAHKRLSSTIIAISLAFLAGQAAAQGPGLFRDLSIDCQGNNLPGDTWFFCVSDDFHVEVSPTIPLEWFDSSGIELLVNFIDNYDRSLVSQMIEGIDIPPWTISFRDPLIGRLGRSGENGLCFEALAVPKSGDIPWTMFAAEDPASEPRWMIRCYAQTFGGAVQVDFYSLSGVGDAEEDMRLITAVLR